jgi:hypothetical protein
MEGGVGSYNNSINKTEILPLDSNEFLSKSLWPNMAENLFASCYIQKDQQRIHFLRQYHFTARRARYDITPKMKAIPK